MAAFLAASRANAPRKPWHVQRFSIGTEWRKPRLKAERSQEIDQVDQQRCLVETGEGVLHDHDALAAFLGAERA